jgi:hypothetical protein
MATIHNLKRAPSIARLECSNCGAATDAACNCGAPYVPALARAADAIEKSPEKSNRAIAAETGLGLETVRRARKTTDPDGSVGPRVGLDGKVRRLPTKTNEVMPTEAEAEESYQETLYDQACLLLESMASETRQRFFAHIKDVYHA